MFNLKVLQTFKKPLERKVAEAVMINNSTADIKMISKAESLQPAVDRPQSQLGIGTDMATPLGMEKYGRIDILPERWVPLDQNAPKLVLTHANEQVELFRTVFHSLFRS